MISSKINTCPHCSSKVFSVYDSDGWRITCSNCEYSGKSAVTELQAEKNYREDLESTAEYLPPIPRDEVGWQIVSERIPEDIPDEGAFYWDAREVEVICKDSRRFKSDVSSLHVDGGRTMVYWRWI